MLRRCSTRSTTTFTLMITTGSPVYMWSIYRADGSCCISQLQYRLQRLLRAWVYLGLLLGHIIMLIVHSLAIQLVPINKRSFYHGENLNSSFQFNSATEDNGFHCIVERLKLLFTLWLCIPFLTKHLCNAHTHVYNISCCICTNLSKHWCEGEQ